MSLMDELTGPATVEKPEFHIESDGAADWYLKQLACYDAEIALIKAQNEAAVKRLQSDRDGLAGLYAAELQAYIAQKLEASRGGRKSVIFAHGTCSFRTISASLKVSDEAAALAFVRGLPLEADVTRLELRKAEYLQRAKAQLDDTGELWEGVEITPAHESFSVKFGKGE